MIYVLDAHTIIWHLDAAPQLSAAAQAVLSDRMSRGVVPTIVLAEQFHLHGRGRTRVSPTRAKALLGSMPNAAVHPLDEQVLGQMPTGLEIHDAIIVATAPVYEPRGTEPVSVVTRDRQIASGGLVDVLW